nr:hypothetical protein [Candidatus Sumerlaeota bacterium]
ALYEVMVMSDRLRDAVIDGVSTNQLKRLAMAEGMQTLRMAGINKVLEGRTTISEVLSATMADTVQEIAVATDKEDQVA